MVAVPTSKHQQLLKLGGVHLRSRLCWRSAACARQRKKAQDDLSALRAETPALGGRTTADWCAPASCELRGRSRVLICPVDLLARCSCVCRHIGRWSRPQRRCPPSSFSSVKSDMMCSAPTTQTSRAVALHTARPSLWPPATADGQSAAFDQLLPTVGARWQRVHAHRGRSASMSLPRPSLSSTDFMAPARAESMRGTRLLPPREPVSHALGLS